MSFRIHRRLLPLSAFAWVASSAPAMAQRISMASAARPIVIESVHSATIPPIVGAIGSAIVSTSGGPVGCGAACFESTINLRANTKWQLQVAINQPLGHGAIDWIEPGTSIAHRLTPGEYLTVASGDEPTLQRAISLFFALRDETGSGAAVGASPVAGLLSYRVVPGP